MRRFLIFTVIFLLVTAIRTAAQAPYITYFTPTTATTGDTVEINGFGFDSAVSVHFGDSLAASFNIVSGNRIKAVVAFCTLGYMDVSVTTAFGVNSRPGFLFIATPYITSFSPATAGLNDIVTINGINLDPINTVTFGGVPGSVIQPLATSTELKVIVGNGATGNVHVFNNFGGTSLPGFTFAATVIADFSYASSSGSYFPPATIQFTDLSTSTALITSWNWDFGDVSNSVQANPIHVYSTAGVYLVKLVVSASGSYDTVLKMIQIAPPTELNICPGASVFLVTDTGSALQWQVSSDSLTFTDITNGTYYSGATSDTLFLNNLPSTFYGNLYRCRVNGVVNSQTWAVTFSNTWTGAAGAAWENPANWSCGSVPDSGTDVIINSGTVVVSSNTTIRSLSIAPGVSFTVAPGVVLTVLH